MHCGSWVLATFCLGVLTETQSRCYGIHVCILMYVSYCLSSSLSESVKRCAPLQFLLPDHCQHFRAATYYWRKITPFLQRLKLGQAWGLITFSWVSEMRFGQVEDKLFWDVNTCHIWSFVADPLQQLGNLAEWLFRYYLLCFANKLLLSA